MDERDPGDSPRVLFYLEHAIQDASLTRTGERRVVSKQMQYVEIDGQNDSRDLHYAPYLDYRPLRDNEPTVDTLLALPECSWVSRDLEQKAQIHAITKIVPKHLNEVRERQLQRIVKTRAAVKDRLTKEINYWDHRAETLKAQEQNGKPNARLNSNEARRRADELQARLEKRIAQLDREEQISALPPVILGGLLVVPMGLIAKLAADRCRLRRRIRNSAQHGRARSSWMSNEVSASSRLIGNSRSWAMTSKVVILVQAGCALSKLRAEFPERRSSLSPRTRSSIR